MISLQSSFLQSHDQVMSVLLILTILSHFSCLSLWTVPSSIQIRVTVRPYKKAKSPKFDLFETVCKKWIIWYFKNVLLNSSFLSCNEIIDLTIIYETIFVNLAYFLKFWLLFRLFSLSEFVLFKNCLWPNWAFYYFFPLATLIQIACHVVVAERSLPLSVPDKGALFLLRTDPLQ